MGGLEPMARAELRQKRLWFPDLVIGAGMLGRAPILMLRASFHCENRVQTYFDGS